MIFEVVSTALRLMAWSVLLGVVAPRVLFRAAARDGTAAASRVVVLAGLTASVLWLLGQLSLGTFLAGLVVYGLGVRWRDQSVSTAGLVRHLWMRFADIFYDDSAVRRDVPEAAAPAKGAASQKPQPGQPTSVPAHARAWARVRQESQALRDSVRPLQERRESLLGALRPVRRRLRRQLRVRAGMLFTQAATALLAGAAVVLRFQRGHPISRAEADQLLALSGWSQTAPPWLPNLVLTDLASELAQTPYSVVTVALGCPLIFIAGWSGQVVFRRLAPNTAPWVGAVAFAATPWAVVASGLPVGPELLVAAILPWLCVCVGRVAAEAGRRPWLMVASGFLHPLASCVAAASLIASFVSERAERTPRDQRWLWLGGLAAAALTAAIGFLGRGWGTWESLWGAAGAPPPTWAAVAACGAAAWLILGGLRGRSGSVVLTGRALGLLTLAVLFVSGGFDGSPRVRLPTLLGPSMMLVVFGVALADAARWIPRRSLRQLPVLLLPVAALLLLPAAAPVEAGGLSRELLDLSSTLRRRHLAWNFSVVAAHPVLPAFADVAWSVLGGDVRDQFPAQNYRFDVEHPEHMIGTRYTYAIFDGSDAEAEMQMSLWLDELKRFDAYPKPELVAELSASDLRVFRLERDPEYERARRR